MLLPLALFAFAAPAASVSGAAAINDDKHRCEGYKVDTTDVKPPGDYKELNLTKKQQERIYGTSQSRSFSSLKDRPEPSLLKDV